MTAGSPRVRNESHARHRHQSAGLDAATAAGPRRNASSKAKPPRRLAEHAARTSSRSNSSNSSTGSGVELAITRGKHRCSHRARCAINRLRECSSKPRAEQRLPRANCRATGRKPCARQRCSPKDWTVSKTWQQIRHSHWSSALRAWRAPRSPSRSPSSELLPKIGGCTSNWARHFLHTASASV